MNCDAIATLTGERRWTGTSFRSNEYIPRPVTSNYWWACRSNPGRRVQETPIGGTASSTDRSSRTWGSVCQVRMLSKISRLSKMDDAPRRVIIRLPGIFSSQLLRDVRLNGSTTSSSSEGYVDRYWLKAATFKTCRITRWPRVWLEIVCMAAAKPSPMVAP